VTQKQEPLEEVLADQAAADLEDATDVDVIGSIAEMVAHPEYPCVGAKSVFRRDNATVVVLEDMEDETSLDELAEALTGYGRAADPGGDFVSFVAIFRQPQIRDERHFEQLLWGVLQHLHDGDESAWAHGVEDDPDKAHFAFSLHGVAYFIVGLHPQASRIARRAPLPTLVFNLHEQFERLRGEGGFERMRDTIRRRDAALQGEANPMAQDHGDISEARQYSGREVEDDWAAPFTTRDER
jgi:FPC/CPF motif-containing protein YcgG